MVVHFAGGVSTFAGKQPSRGPTSIWTRKNYSWSVVPQHSVVSVVPPRKALSQRNATLLGKRPQEDALMSRQSLNRAKCWEMVAMSAFLFGREVGKRMVTRERGTIIFTGATASLRGRSGFAAFSGAMMGKRSLAQAMAHELGPRGVHVAHVTRTTPLPPRFCTSRSTND